MDFNNNNVEIPNLGSALAINALDSIPNTKPDAKQIVALVKRAAELLDISCQMEISSPKSKVSLWQRAVTSPVSVLPIEKIRNT